MVKGLKKQYKSLSSQSRIDAIDTGKTIDEQTTEGDKIILLGRQDQIYLFTSRDTASRYIYQLSGVAYEPNAQNDFLMNLHENEPTIIVVKKSKDGRYDHLPEWYAPVYDMIKNKYQMITDKNGYFLFKRILASDRAG